MTVLASIKREFEIYGTNIDNEISLYPRDFSNQSFSYLTNYQSNTVSKDRYEAFPYAIKIGSSIVGIFSSGVAHAQSDKHKIFRTDDNGKTYEIKDFFINSTEVMDLSLLDGLLSVGDIVNLKVWSIKKTADSYQVTTTSSISANGKSYALWSKPKITPDGNLYRTAYSPTGNWETGLLVSFNDGETWTFKSVIAPSTSGRTYNEADIVNTVGNNWVAYIREDVGASDNLYKSTSSDNGNTWSVPTLVNSIEINGRQPNLTKLSDGSIILATGDRTGVSGFSGNGEQISSTLNTTGITIWRSTDNCATWSYRTRLAPIFSTDGGQPFVIDLGSGNIYVVWYGRKGVHLQPQISSCTLNVLNI